MSPYLLSLSTLSPTLDYCLSNAWLFAASDFILLTDVQRELRVVKPPQRADEPIENAPLSRRIAWATKLFTSARGLGWAHEPRYANPPRPSPLDSARRLPSGWLWRYLVVWAWCIPLVGLSVCNHALSAAFSVGTGASGPEDWPPFLGSITLAWSVRNFWGRIWHQTMRRFLSAHGKFLAHRVLRLKPGSKASGYTQLYVAFLISGIMHYLPEYMALRHWGGGALRFFLLQAVAITFEECVQDAGRRLGLKAGWVWKAVGYSWVWSWFAYCLPGWQDPLLHEGVFEEVRYSVVVMLRRHTVSPKFPPLERTQDLRRRNRSLGRSTDAPCLTGCS
ncbi:membrane bound O-acyl transferase family-domain-containing protein [Mycena vitilis]|nr:membrane bound O-acyl transferase family-domain-containing protein [Mycena vitilis]